MNLLHTPLGCFAWPTAATKGKACYRHLWQCPDTAARLMDSVIEARKVITGLGILPKDEEQGEKEPTLAEALSRSC